MLAAVLLSLLSLHAAAAPRLPPLPAAMTADDMATLHKRLMDKVDAMGRANSGIFDDDVTAMVSPYFPPGQPLAETAATLREEGIGDLKPYRGKTGPDDGTMFAARDQLMSEAFNHVFVVLHFAYRHAPDGSLVLDHMRARLRSDAM